jgi:hypothetical protein
MFRRREVALVIAVAIGSFGCHAASYAAPELPPPPGPIYVDSAEEAEGAGGVAAGGVSVDAYQDNDPSALDDFRAPLEGHGTWIDDTLYGTVWRPAPEEVGSDFVPYVTAGHWVYDEDYVWVSEYPWGWVPFHYGRWVLIAGRGWVWVPGRVYAGAWVVWRVGDADDFGYVGWAPLPPTWIWRERISVRIAVAPPARFVFCPRQEIFVPVVGTRVIYGREVNDIERRTHLYAPPAYRTEGRIAAQPAVGGPPPSLLHIDPSRVSRPTPRDPGLDTAHRYAVPSTAYQIGARLPTPKLAPPRLPQPPAARFPLGTAAPQPQTAVPRPAPTAIPQAPRSLPTARPPVRTTPRPPVQTSPPNRQTPTPRLTPAPAPRAVPGPVPQPRPTSSPQRARPPQRVLTAPGTPP